MENGRLRQLALLDLGILNFGLMQACRKEDAPLRIDRYTILARLSARAPNFRPNRRFQFQKRSQYLIGVHNETLSVAVCVCDPDVRVVPNKCCRE